MYLNIHNLPYIPMIICVILIITVWAQKSDIPFEVNSFLKQKDTQSVAEMIGLYSKLRETARNAMSGTSKQKNTARIANTVAEAILKERVKSGEERV